jgi:hypothetical protein
MASARFKEVERRLVELRRAFLPATFDPTGTYPSKQADLTRAYQLLAHAEIESYLEDVAFETVLKTCGKWDKSRRVSRALLSLVAFHGDRPAAIGDASAISPRPVRELDDLVNSAKALYSKYVKTENNGIRAANIRRLLLPAGVGEHELDFTWLAAIDSFGAKRGETAHTAKSTVSVPDPETEYKAVQDIVVGLGKIDGLLRDLRR